MMVAAAMKAGFSGGLVVDYPHSTRARKYFLVLMVGETISYG
jgi:18S rRNA (guanine1575-N7)-methyltransferase